MASAAEFFESVRFDLPPRNPAETDEAYYFRCGLTYIVSLDDAKLPPQHELPTFNSVTTPLKRNQALIKVALKRAKLPYDIGRLSTFYKLWQTLTDSFTAYATVVASDSSPGTLLREQSLLMTEEDAWKFLYPRWFGSRPSLCGIDDDNIADYVQYVWDIQQGFIAGIKMD